MRFIDLNDGHIYTLADLKRTGRSSGLKTRKTTPTASKSSSSKS